MSTTSPEVLVALDRSKPRGLRAQVEDELREAIRSGRLAPGTLVCDIVTRPATTRFLREAAARDCVTHPGMPMLAGQVDLILEFLGLSGDRPG